MATAANFPNGIVAHCCSVDNPYCLDGDGRHRLSCDTIELSYHGNCPKCHHQHTNIPFRFFRDLKKHTRFECKVCKHLMFGIGRTSTQTTLASIESRSPRPSYDSLTSSRGNSRTCFNGPTKSPSQTVPDIGSQCSNVFAIRGSYGNSGLHSPSLSASGPIPLKAAPLDQENTESFLEPPTLRNGSNPDHDHETHGDSQTEIQSRSTPKRFRTIWAKVTRVFRKPEILRGSVSRLRSRAAPSTSRNTTPRKLTPRKNLNDAEVSVSMEPPMIQTRGTLRDNPTVEGGTAVPFPTSLAFDDNLPLVPEAEENRTSGHAGHPDEFFETQLDLVKHKHDRIRNIRREKTLKNNARRKPRCACHHDCHCKRGSSDSNHPSDGQRDPIAALDIADHTLQSLIGPPIEDQSHESGDSRSSWGPPGLEPLAGLGRHFPLADRSSSAENSNSTADRRDGVSQGTTVFGSTRSSISLPGRRPSPRRSFTMPVLPLHQLGDPFRPGVRSVLRGVSVLDRADLLVGEGSGLQSLPEMQNGLDDRQSQSSTHSVAPPHGSTISLANLPDPQEEEPTEERSANGEMGPTQVPSSTQTPVAGSEERTPRPRSHTDFGDVSPVSAQPRADEVSVALQDLADGQTLVDSSSHSGDENL
ncbi:hypothetical protein MMC12_007917 [Toensbergia leucococca]|nr:hypothetical protein [Toensbergia leucococca]